MNSLRIIISSPPDRDAVVAELWQEDEQVAELRQDTSGLRLELYDSRSLSCRDLDYSEFMTALSQLTQAVS
jgi:hypothetical protein